MRLRSNRASCTFLSPIGNFTKACMITKSNSRKKERAFCGKEKKELLANALSIKQHPLEWRGSERDESHGQKVITAMGCHAKMFH